MAFEAAKAMQADGLEWGEGYRPLGARRSPRSSRAGSEALDYWLDSLDGSAMRD